MGGGGYYGFDSRRRVVDHGSKHPSELRFSFVKALLGAVGTNMQSARSGLNGGKRSVVVNKYVRYYTKQKKAPKLGSDGSLLDSGCHKALYAGASFGPTVAVVRALPE